MNNSERDCASGTVMVVGSINMDLVAYGPRLPSPGETVLAERFARVPGGKGANQAVAAARSGARTVFVGAVGTDDFGVELRATLEHEGIDVRHLTSTTATSSGLALISVDEAGNNLITVVGGANSTIGESDLYPVRPLLQPGCVVVMQLEIPLATVSAMARIAREAGATIVLNPAPAQPLPVDLLQHVDILIPNEHELLLSSGADENSTMAEQIAALHTSGARTVVISRGAHGVLVDDTDRQIEIPAHSVQAVDTTAAGDTLIGALSAELARGSELEQAVRFGNAAAGLSVQTPGAQPSIPYRHDTERVLRRV